MSHVGCDLAYAHEKIQCGHPFVGAEARLAREVMEMCYEALKDVC